MDRFAVDASVAAGWCFPDEQTPYTDAVLDAVSLVPVFAPSIWTDEVRNIVLMGLRRKRVTASEADRFLAFLDLAPIRIVEPPSPATVFDIARRFDLSYYDASYLELAPRQGLRLATLDRALQRAAMQAGVALVSI